MPAGLLIATSARGQRTDLLTVPSDSSDQAARAAMDQAARAGNRTHAPALLAAVTRPARMARAATGTASASTGLGTWEWEGGQLHDHEAAPARSRPTAPAWPSRALAPAAGARCS